VPAESVAGFHVYFPDPWPKKRHHKRRFVRKDNMAMLIERLKPGGTIQLATDHEGYFEQMQEVASAFRSELEEIEFVRPAGAADGERTGTNYERKYICDQRTIRVLAFRKRPAGPKP
jgi:tRNA (guanine-N7-)-methyltransferase